VRFAKPFQSPGGASCCTCSIRPAQLSLSVAGQPISLEIHYGREAESDRRSECRWRQTGSFRSHSARFQRSKISAAGADDFSQALSTLRAMCSLREQDRLSVRRCY
jgi:hypothetical protein